MDTRTGSTFSVVAPVKNLTEINPEEIRRKSRLNTLGLIQLLLGLNMFVQEIPAQIFMKPVSGDVYYMGFWSGFLHMWSGSMNMYTGSFFIKRPSKYLILTATLLNICLTFVNFLSCLFQIVAVQSAAFLYKDDLRILVVTTVTRGMLLSLFLFPVAIAAANDSFRLIPRKPALPELTH